MKNQKKTIPAEYLRLRLEQVLALATRRAAPKTGDVELRAVLDAVRWIADDIAKRDAESEREQAEWLGKLLAKLPTGDDKKPTPRRRRTEKPDA